MVFPSRAIAEARYIAIFGTRTRFVVMFLVLLCLTSIWSNVLCFNFAVICMNDDGYERVVNSSIFGVNSAFDSRTAHRLVTDGQESFATAVVAIAALLGNFPVVHLINKLGIRTVFAGLGVLSAVSTLLIPTAIRLGFYWFVATRFLQGVALAANFPVIGSFCAKWAYFKQNGLFVSALVAYIQLAPAFSNPASGALCSTLKWPSIFYAHGAVSLLLFITYGFFYRNSPGKHPFVGNVELRKISVGKISNVDMKEYRPRRNRVYQQLVPAGLCRLLLYRVVIALLISDHSVFSSTDGYVGVAMRPTDSGKQALQAIPYAAILRTPAVWAIWISSLGNFFCVNIMFLYSPKYLSSVLGFATHKTGIAAALPALAQFLCKLSFGFVSDRVKCVSEKNKLRIFNSIAFYGSSAFFVILAFLGDSNKNLNVLVLGAGVGILGATTGGFFKAGPVISKQYSHFVTGNVSLGITLTLLVVPFIVSSITHDHTQEEWKWVFLIVAAVMVVTNTVFVILIKGEACEWTKDDFVRSQSRSSVKVQDATTGSTVAGQRY